MQTADDHHASAERTARFSARAADATAKAGGHTDALWLQEGQYMPAHGEQNGLRSMVVRFLLQHRCGLRGDLVDGL
jgi:hypothetical protein